ncbi:YheC/YheD family protein [Bacillus massilinigeriensis]|uniref:YheC/YheD family protein n=1 Tax=Bacillus mediterraneensis TaxID=1805474 RepID=UPI00093A89A3|nr:YheC/YheD family protein [Bacillus mediterraneensis]
MKIYYDPWQEGWYHQDAAKGDVFFGAISSRLPFVTTPRGKNLSFEICFDEEKRSAGPLIGIMTAGQEGKSIPGNSPMFISIHHEAVRQHGLSIVFTPPAVAQHGITGYIYMDGKWAKVKAPLPNVVYNRIPCPSEEKTNVFRCAKEILDEWRVPFFNPSFIDKLELYNAFQKNTFLATTMPKTINVSKKEDLESFLEENSRVYLKKRLSSRGKDMYALRLCNRAIEMLSHNGSTKYQSFHAFWEQNSTRFLDSGYIAQQEVSPSLLNGRRYDFRVHAVDGPKGYIVTGVGIRLSQKQNLTTHIPNGGILFPYEPIRTREHDRFFEKAVQEAGKLLAAEFGYFGEFSMDAGLSVHGEYVIFEINSKPMIFDETEIEQKRVELLTRLLFKRAGF